MRYNSYIKSAEEGEGAVASNCASHAKAAGEENNGIAWWQHELDLFTTAKPTRTSARNPTHSYYANKPSLLMQ